MQKPKAEWQKVPMPCKIVEINVNTVLRVEKKEG